MLWCDEKLRGYYNAALDLFDRIESLRFEFYVKHGYYPSHVQLSNDDDQILDDYVENNPYAYMNRRDPKLPHVSTIYDMIVTKGDETYVFKKHDTPK